MTGNRSGDFGTSDRVAISRRHFLTVGAAVGANPLAVAIPCHRVIRHDGSLCGYRWGVDRKRALIEREAAT